MPPLPDDDDNEAPSLSNLASDELNAMADSDALDGEVEHRDRLNRENNLGLTPEFIMERARAQLNELKQSVEQTSSEVVAATLPAIYQPVVETVEEAKSLSEKDREAIVDLARDVMDEVDDKLDDADPEIRELHDTLSALALDVASNEDEGKIETDKADVVNSFNSVVAKVNEANEANAQILSGSSGQDVKAVKVEPKVEAPVGASVGEFMKSVNKANDDLKGQQEVINDYYSSYADDKGQQSFEEKNEELRRASSVRYVTGSALLSSSAQQNVSSLLSSSAWRNVSTGLNDPADDEFGDVSEPSVPKRFGLNPDDFPRIGQQRGKTYGLNEANLSAIPTRPPPPSFPVVGTISPPQAQQPAAAAAAAETVQEPMAPPQARKRTDVPTPIQIIRGDDGKELVYVDNARLEEMRQSAKGLSPAPLTYEQYKAYLRSHNLLEYFDNGECEYFYLRFQKLSNRVPENIKITKELSIGIPVGAAKMMTEINIAISLYLFKPNLSPSMEPLAKCRNNFLSLLALLNQNDYLIFQCRGVGRIFFNEVGFGKVMEEYEKGTSSRVHDFFEKLLKGGFTYWESETNEEVNKTYADIQNYIWRFDKLPENLGTEVYRNYLHDMAEKVLDSLDSQEESEQSPESNQDERMTVDTSSFDILNQTDRSGSSFYVNPSNDSMSTWAQDEYYDDYVRGWEDD